MTFAEWSMTWLESYKKPFVTNNTYLYSYYNMVVLHLIPFFGERDISTIKPLDVQSFFGSNSHLSESTLGKLHMCLVSIFKTAIDNDYCMKSPVRNVIFKSVQIKHIKHVYSEKEIKAVRDFSFYVFPAVVLLLETGLRRGELVGLCWSDIDFNNRTLSVNRSIADQKGGGTTEMPPKWKSYRILPLSPLAFSLLLSLYRSSIYVFPNKFGSVQSPCTFSKNLARHMRRVSNGCHCLPLTAHELRHTYGTHLRRLGIDIYTIQKVMGHKDVNITSNTYVHNEVESLRSALGYSLGSNVI